MTTLEDRFILQLLPVLRDYLQKRHQALLSDELTAIENLIERLGTQLDQLSSLQEVDSDSSQGTDHTLVDFELKWADLKPERQVYLAQYLGYELGIDELADDVVLGHFQMPV